MNDDWLNFAVSVATVGNIYCKHGALRDSTGLTKTLRHAIVQLKMLPHRKPGWTYYCRWENSLRKNSAAAQQTINILTYREWRKNPFDYEYGKTKMTSTAKTERHERFCFFRKRMRHRETRGAASRTLTPDVMREEELAKLVRYRTAARPKYNPGHSYIVFSTTTPTRVYCRTTCRCEIYYVYVRTCAFDNIGHLHFDCKSDPLSYPPPL